MNDLQTAIEQEAKKLIRRFEEYARRTHDETERRRRRTVSVHPPLQVHRPNRWSLAPGFNPYLVRARASAIAHSVQRSVRSQGYRPRPAAQHSVPKGDGSPRVVSVCQVADTAVSTQTYRSLNAKNLPILSGRSYAYRQDRTAHDGLRYIASETRGAGRLFVAEYDFASYFNSIDHDYIRKALRDFGFLVSPREKSIIEAFLSMPALPEEQYTETSTAVRTRGVPQGASISLFLANVAAFELDRELERLGVSFVRYADDTLIWSRDYSEICRAAEVLHEVSTRIGSPINLDKSDGIRILAPDGAQTELPRTTYLEFLGHRMTPTSISLSDQVVSRVKSRIRRLLYFNLIREPLIGAQNGERFAGTKDRDYITFVWQVRRYLYGDLSESRLRRMERRGETRVGFRGLMSFFPLVDDTDKLVELDRWFLCQVVLVLRRRYNILAASGYGPFPAPCGLSGEALTRLFVTSDKTGQEIDLRLPSFARIGRAVARSVTAHGASAVAGGTPYLYQSS